MNHIHLDTVQTITIFELLCWLTHGHIPQILSLVLSCTDPLPFASPHTELHFVVGIVCAGIKDVDVAVRKISSNISFPQVPVNKRWFDLAAVFFERSQKPWNHMAECAVRDCIKLWPWATLLLLNDENGSKQLREEASPTRIPSHFLGESTMTCGNVEAKHSSRRFARSMELCKLGAELDWIRHVVGHVNKVAQKEVRLRCFHLELAPGQRFRNKTWESLVKRAHRVELSLHHHSTRFLGRNLEKILFLRPTGKQNVQASCDCPCGGAIAMR